MLRVKTRVVFVTTVALAALFILILSTQSTFDYDSYSYFKNLPGEESDKPMVGQHHTKELHQYWNKIFTILGEHKVPEELKKLLNYVDGSKQVKGDVKNKEVLLSKAEISPELLELLGKSHRSILEQFPEGLSRHTYKKGSTGVVLIGGGKFSWLSYLSILALRETGSKLPVQVILPQYSDIEKEIKLCGEILPALNASCIVVPDVLGLTVMLHWSHFSLYQFKSLALITSTFDNILLLDSDNILLTNPDDIFKSELYKQYGMITWPDYWVRTTSPHFYNIAGRQVSDLHRVRWNRFPLHNAGPANNEVPYHDLDGAIPDLSTESGQLFINKATHGRTLLLSLYYNVYGPGLYYKLFSLGEMGEGDKDTFVTAAEITNEPYYQVKSFIKTSGFINGDNNFQGVAMGQGNPIIDHELFVEHVINNKGLAELPEAEQIQKLKDIENKHFSAHSSTPLFTLHCNYPKLDPLDLMSRENLIDQENNRMRFRVYSNFATEKTMTDVNGHASQIKVDFELQQWNHIKQALCEKGLKFDHFKNSDMTKVCDFIKNSVEWLKETSKAY